MSKPELLLQPDDSPSGIVDIRISAPTFSTDECDKIESLPHMFEKLGNEVHEAAYPVFMRRFNSRLDT